MTFVLDMDGTIANLYGEENWLEKLRNFDATPYRNAKPLCDPDALSIALHRAIIEAKAEVIICTWLSKETNKEYDWEVRKAKREWLKAHDIPYTHFRAVPYGTNKGYAITMLKDGPACIFDDDKRVRDAWYHGPAVNPEEVNIIDYIHAVCDTLMMTGGK